MTETNPNTTPPASLAGAAGSWQLDPAGTTVELRTKAMWGLAKVRGRFNALEGSGVVGEDGTVSGTRRLRRKIHRHQEQKARHPPSERRLLRSGKVSDLHLLRYRRQPDRTTASSK